MSDGDRQITDITDAARLLYDGPAEEFITRRDALIKKLRAAGFKELALDVKALRKPSVVAAELNRIARAEPEAVEALIAAASSLRAAQDEVLSGGDSDLVEPRRVYRAAIARVASSALRHQVKVQAAIEAAAADPAQHAQLRDGTFAAEPQATVGFGSVSTPVEQPRAQPAKEAATSTATSKPAPTRRQLIAAVKAAEKAFNAAEKRLRAARESADAAAAAATELDEQAESLERQLAKIQRARVKAQTKVVSAQSKLDEVTEAHEAANRGLIGARQVLADRDSAGD